MGLGWPAVILAIMAFAAGPVAGQVTVQVVDEEGRPIPNVQIDIYGRGELIGSEVTPTLGIATLGPDRWADVRRIALYHLGFQTLVVQAEEIPTDGPIQLERQPIEIEGLEAEARDFCPVDDGPDARALWSEVAANYSKETGFRALSAYFSRSSCRVSEGAVHQDSEADGTNWVFAVHPYVIHGEDQVPRPLDHRIATEGYAWPPVAIEGGRSGRALAWAYPALDREQAYHFASPTFGALHDLSVESRRGEEVTLAFCPNGRGEGATISGLITLLPGETMRSARWRFETEAPHEGAGGSVVFASYREGPNTLHLVARRGVYYRRSGVGSRESARAMLLAREVTDDMQWFLHPSDDHPCNEGRTFGINPPSTADGVTFVECVAAHWGGR